MKPSKLVSIVLPTFNGARYLSESLESIINQTYQNWELIIVDDCCTDSTPQIIETFIREKKIESKVRVIRNPQNLKLPASLNIGFKSAQGDYFTWTSDDNRYLPDALEVMVLFLEHSENLDLVYASYNQIDSNGHPISGKCVKAQPVDRLWETSVVGACFLYRRKVHEKLGGYNEKLFLVEDYDFWLRAASQFNFLPLHTVLYEYRIHEGTLTSKRALEIARGADEVILIHLSKYYFISKRFSAQAALRVLVKAVERRDKSLALRAILEGIYHARFQLIIEAIRKILRNL